MHVSFHGIKNIGAAYEYRDQAKVVSVNTGNSGPFAKMYIPEGKSFELHLELNNKGEKDLKEFKEILNKYPNPHIENKNVLDIMCDRAVFTDSANQTRRLNVCKINGHIVDMNDENYSVCQKLIKLVGKVSEIEEKDLVYDKNYRESDSCKKSYPFYFLRFKKDPQTLTKILDEFLNPRSIKASSTMMMSNLLMMMFESREKNQ